MSKILILLLFTFVLNLKMEDGITVYQISDMKKIMDNIYELNVKEGEEFYIKMFRHKISVSVFSNIDEFKDYLDDFGKKGNRFKSVDAGSSSLRLKIAAYDYFKFKALKPSVNKISLKFSNISPSFFGAPTTTNYVFKINILSKNETS